MGLAATNENQHSGNRSSISGTILFLAWLNAFIATTVASSREDSKESVGGHWQKEY